MASENTKSIALSPGDLAMNEFCGISTVTYYRDPLPLEFLEQRTQDIVKLNPWLASRLVKVDGSIKATYNSESFAIGDYFQKAHINELTSKCTFLDASALLKEHLVKKGKECVDQNEPLFRVTAVTTNSNESMLVFSLSHTLGDGYTFYSIYAMFEKEPFAMISERVPDFGDNCKKVMGASYYQFLSSPGFMMGVVANLFSSAPPIVSKEIDQNYVKKLKDSAKQVSLQMISSLQSFFPCLKLILD
jgi:hypothetical protein